MIQFVITVLITVAPIASVTATQSAEAGLTSTKSASTGQLNFTPFRRYLLQNSSCARGEVDSQSLNILASGEVLTYDGKMIILIGLPTLREHCDDEQTRAAIDVISKKVDEPTSQALQDALKTLHQWLEQQTRN